MPAIAQSVSWWCFVPEKLTAEEFVRSAADAGYVALDLVPPEHFSFVTDYGLKIAAIAGHEVSSDLMRLQLADLGVIVLVVLNFYACERVEPSVLAS